MDSFRARSANNFNIFRDSCYILVEDQDEPLDDLIVVNGNDASIIPDNSNETGNVGSSETLEYINRLTGVSGSDSRERYSNSIDTITKSRSRFSKRDKLATDRV